jgi:hypothetical protein
MAMSDTTMDTMNDGQAAGGPSATSTIERQRDPLLDWLRAEFPDWEVSVERTTTPEGVDRPLWIASRDGHHPQSALTGAKLHTRLSDYLDRESRRNASRN